MEGLRVHIVLAVIAGVCANEFAFQRHLDPLICFCRAHGRDKQTDRPRYMRSNTPHLYAMHCDPKNYSERQNCRHQLRGQHDDETMKYRQHTVKLYHISRYFDTVIGLLLVHTVLK